MIHSTNRYPSPRGDDLVERNLVKLVPKFNVQRIVVLAASLAITGLGVTLPASPAAAAPTGCSKTDKYGPPGEVWVKCTGGTGYYRAGAYCTTQPGGGGAVTVFGVWRGAKSGDSSVATCPGGQPYLYTGWSETR